MEKIKLGVVFGGNSVEHDVSIESGTSVITHLNKEKYNIFPIYIDKNGIWHEYENQNKIIKIGEKVEPINKIDNVFEYLKQLDVVFPVLHGLQGEDGTVQGLFEMLGLPYVGCKVLASSIGMDKAYTKMIFERAGLGQARYVYLRKNKEDYTYIDKSFNESKMSLDDICNRVQEEIKFPMFIKPSNSGSSLGINKAKTEEELKEAIIEAIKYDDKIVVEEGIEGQELECAVLGNEDVISSCVGEILPAEEFYSFDAKYMLLDSKTLIPARISEEKSKEIREAAIKAFKSIDGKGLSRVDFFLEKGTNRVLINEINTLPGFTNISMYPKMFEATGISYEELLDRLIELSI